MEEERMPRVNLSKDAVRLTTTDLHFMKKIESENLDRAIRMKKIRSNNRKLGTFLGALAIGIYSYTIYAVKQEKFLDDFDEPEKIADAE